MKNIPEWDPKPKPKEGQSKESLLYEEALLRCDLADFCFCSVESSEDLFPEDPSCDRLTFYHFDVSRLLKHGASLLGSAGAEFEMQDDKAGLDLLQWKLMGLMLEQAFNLAVNRGESCSFSDGLGWFFPHGKSAKVE